MTVTEIEAATVGEQELDVLEHARKQLPEGSSLALALEVLDFCVRNGVDFVYASAEQQLTTTQAAALLKVSRPHLYKLLDEGVIPYMTVGKSARRLRMQDLVCFIRGREKARCDLAETFASADQTRRALVERLRSQR